MVGRVASLGLAGLTVVSTTPMPIYAEEKTTEVTTEKQTETEATKKNKYSMVRSGTLGGTLQSATGANDEGTDGSSGESGSSGGNTTEGSGNSENTGSTEGETSGGETEGNTGGSDAGGSESESTTGKEDQGNTSESSKEDPSCYSLIEIADLDGVKSNAYVNGDTCYYTDMFISVASVASVDGDVVSKIELVDGKDSKKVYGKEENYKDGDKVVFSLPDEADGLVVRCTITRDDQDYISENDITKVIDSLKDVTKFRRMKGSISIEEGENTCEIKTVNGNDYLTKDGKMVWIYSREIGIDTENTTCTVNGEAVDLSMAATDSGEVIISLDTNGFPEGDISVVLEVKDKLGLSGTYKKDLYVSRKMVSISGKNHEGKVYVVDGVTYTKSGLKLTLSYPDSTTVISKVDLMKGNDVIDTLSGDSLDENFIISDSGDYSVRVTDIFENSNVVRLEDLFQDITSHITVDDEEAVVSATVNDAEVNLADFYVDKAVLKVSISDNVGLENCKISLNGTEVANKGMSNVKEDVISVDLSKYAPGNEGIYNVTIELTDSVGNTSGKSYKLKCDFGNPEIKNPELSGTYNLEDGIIYTSKGLTLSLNASDTESGVKEIRIFRNGSLVSNTGSYSIKSSGVYTVEVEDNVGHIATYGLNDLASFNEPVKSIIVDTESPVIERVEGFDNGTTLDDKSTIWYSKANDLKVKVTDEEGNLSSVTITVNNKEVKVNPTDDGIYTISSSLFVEGNNIVVVNADDKSGNTASDKFTFTLDTECPKNVTATVAGDYVENGKSVYFKAPAKVTVKAEDEGSGVSTYVVGTEESPSGSFTLGSGTYKVKVKDKLGNTTQEFDLTDLLGMKGDSIVIDGDAPVISEKSGFKPELEEFGVKWFSKKPTLVYNVSDDNIDEVTITVNGKEYQKSISTTGDYQVDLSEVSDGLVQIRISATDKSGNTSSSSYSFKLDMTSPTDISASVGDRYTEYNGVVYFKSSPSLSLSAKDAGVGVSDILINGKPITGTTYSLTDGTFKVSVKDKLGNESEAVDIAKLLGMKGSTFVIDGIDPTVNRSSGFDEDLKESGTLWFAKKPKLIYSISDKNILSVDITVNGKKYPQTLSSDGKYKVDLSEVSDGAVDVLVSVKDKAGNSSSDKFTFKLDTAVPTGLKGKVNRSYKEVDGIMYFDGVPTLQLQASDEGVGISTYLYNDEESAKGDFIIGNGSHKIKVRDKLGNTSTEVTLGSLLGSKGNTVVIDMESPVIEKSSGFFEDYKDGSKSWYSSVPNPVYSVTDENISAVKITVNGVSTEQEIKKSGKYPVDLSGVQDGKVVVSISAIDKAGNTAESTYTFYLDRKSPKNLSASVNEDFKNLTNGIFFKKEPTLTLTAEDEGVGVANYTVNNTVKESGVFKLSGGEYTVLVTDILGNATTPVKLSSLLNLKSDTIIVDGDAPVIKKSSGFDVNYNGDGKDWYSSVPSLSYRVTDSYLKEVTISVNGEGKAIQASSDGTYKVPLTGISDGKVTVDIKAEDYSGNVSTDSYTFYLDRTAPHGLEASLSTTSYLERDTGVFFKSSPEVKLTAKDSGVGVGNYILNGTKKKDGTFKLSGGTYTVSMEDILGNKAGDVDLSKLLGLKSTKFVIDGEAPTISATKPAGGINNWYKTDQSYPVKIADNVGIQSASVTINGKVVDKFESSGRDITTVSLTGNTSSVSANSDGSYTVEVNVVDKAGNQSEWKDTIYIDKSKPTVEKFVFSGANISSGAEINGSDRYGFFYDGSATVSIYVSDGNVTSGLKSVIVTLNNKNGGTSTKTLSVSSGVAVLSLPNNFKGTISAHAIDNVGNESSEEKPDGIVSETSNWHSNSVDLSLNLPSTSHKDNAGLPLYNSSVNVEAIVGCGASGIKSVKWGVDGTTLGTASVDLNGRISGGGSIQATDKNLVLSMKNVVPVNENSNNLKVWVEVTDRLGNTSEISKTLSIDTDKPIVTVNYDTPVTDAGYYKDSKTARITIDDRNFSTDAVKVTGNAGTLSNWFKSGNKWVATMTFTKDGEYSWGLTATDMAGNASVGYKSPNFAIDKEAPKVRFEYDNQTPKNKNYYSEKRKVTIVVDDFNFDEKGVKFEGNGELGKWVKIGDTYRATIDCSKDGEYMFSFSCADKSGNKSETIESEKFIVDTKKPTLKVEGISDGVSYKRNIKLDINFEDTNLDKDEVRLSLVGRKNGAIEVEGDFDKESGSYHFEGFEDDEKYDDVYTLRVSVSDKAGNEVEKVYTFSLNRYGSHYSSNDAELFGNYLNKAKDVTLKEENVDRLDIKKCKVVVVKDGKTLDVDDKDITITESESTSGWAYEYKVDKSVFEEDGMYQIRVYSSSSDGTKYSSVSEEYSFILDTKEPEVVLSGIENGGNYRDYKRKVTIDVRDLSGVDKIIAKVNGEEVAVSEVDGIYSFEVVESGKLQNVTVEVIDKAGNSTIQGISGFYLSTNPLVFLVNQSWFKFGAGVFGSFIVVILGLLGRRFYISRKEESESIKEQKEMYDKSRSSSSSSSSSKKED